MPRYGVGARGKGAEARGFLQLAAALIVISLAADFATGGKFLAWSNLVALLSHAVIPTFIVWGMCFVFTSGIMDLSMGAILILASNVGGLLALRFGYVGLVVGAVATAVALQMLNLLICTRTRIPSWIVGLGMAMVYEAVGSVYSAARTRVGGQVVSLGDSNRALGVFPYNLALWAIGGLAAYLVFNRAAVGIDLRAVGGNAQVAKMMGVDPKRAILRAGLVGGVFVGIAAAINESYAGRVMPVTGLSSIAIVFTPLAVFLLAQALQSRINLTIGVMIAGLLLFALYNVLTILGVPSGTWQDVVLGLCIVVFGIFSQRNTTGVVK